MPWGTVWEEHLAAVSGGDAVKLARLREIYTWFTSAMAMYAEAMQVKMKASEEERILMIGDGVVPIEILYWAMMEAESTDPMRRARWAKYRSHVLAPSGPEEDAVAVIKEMQVPSSQAPPIGLEDDEVVALRRRMTQPGVAHMPRRSPRFPRRSARLRALTRFIV